MTRPRLSIGINHEVYAQVRGAGRRRLPAFLLRLVGIMLASGAVLTGLVLATDIEQLVQPRTVIMRGNRLSSASEVIEITSLRDRTGLNAMIPASISVPEGRSRWIRSFSTRMLSGRRMLLDIDERMPLLPLEIGGNPYWICSDGEVVKRSTEGDRDGHFEELNRLPLVTMQGSGIDAEYEITEMLLLTAGVCRDLLDRRITGIEVQANGEFNLMTDKGIIVQLGIPEDEDQLRHRLSALSKAIRISDQYADATAIDLRNGNVAYLRTSKTE